MTTYPDDRWAWWASRDGDFYQVGPCASCEEAIEQAVEDGCYNEIDPEEGSDDWTISLYVVEAVRPEVSDMTIDGGRCLEDLECDGLFDLDREETDSLSRYLTDALHAWAVERGVRFNTWMFAATRNGEKVVLPHPHPS